jgi:hypothetical protein
MKGSFAAACFLTLLGVTSRGAPPDDWSSTSSGLWGTGGNWTKGVPGSGTAVQFNASAGLQTNLTLLASSSAGSLSFLSAGGANAYTFDTLATQNTNTLTVSSGITNSEAGGLTFYDTTTLGVRGHLNSSQDGSGVIQNQPPRTGHWGHRRLIGLDKIKTGVVFSGGWGRLAPR